MPTYEYGCEACGKTWELEQRITEDPIKKCPKCGKLKAKRLISGGSFMLKGGGWYADGYGSGKKAAAASSGSEGSATKSETPAKSEGAAKSESPAKSEAKPSSGAADS
jgi:putative FmdB family regulatory protein